MLAATARGHPALLPSPVSTAPIVTRRGRLAVGQHARHALGGTALRRREGLKRTGSDARGQAGRVSSVGARCSQGSSRLCRSWRTRTSLRSTRDTKSLASFLLVRSLLLLHNTMAFSQEIVVEQIDAHGTSCLGPSRGKGSSLYWARVISRLYIKSILYANSTAGFVNMAQRVLPAATSGDLLCIHSGPTRRLQHQKASSEYRPPAPEY
jgi:hypothetical protein